MYTLLYTSRIIVVKKNYTKKHQKKEEKYEKNIKKNWVHASTIKEKTKVINQKET